MAPSSICAALNVRLDVCPGVPVTWNWMDANSPDPVSGPPVAYAVMYMTPGVLRFEAIAKPAEAPIPEMETDCGLTTALSYVIVMSMPSTSLAVVIEIGT
jgi:hypothetical protein